MVKLLKCGFLILFFANIYTAHAQDYLMPEISYPFMDKLVAAAKASYPKMETYDRRVIIAQDNVTKTKKTWMDFLNFSMSYSPTNTTTVTGLSLSGYQVGMAINVANILQKPYVIKQAKNDLIIAQLDKEEYNLNISTEVKNRYIKYIQQLAALKLQKQTAVDIEALYKQSKYKFEKAEETFENYSKSLIAFTEQRQNIIATEAGVLMAKISLEEIIGKKLEEIR